MGITGIYRHFKGNNYEVIGEAIDENTYEPYVFYRQLYDPFTFWIKPSDMFFGMKQVGNRTVERYVKIAERQKDIISKVNLFEITITHTETGAKYQIVEILNDKYVIKKIEK